MGLLYSTPNENQLQLLNSSSIAMTFNSNSDNSDNDSDNNSKYKNLVLSGGGVKGIAHCGALKYLQENGILPKINKIAATSAGSIIAALVAVGYTPEEIETEMMKLDFSKFVKDDTPLANIYNLVTKYGWCKGNYIKKTLGTLIQKKTGNCNYTFENLKEDRNIELVLTGTNLNKQNTIYFHHAKTPKMSICEAVRISMSIPFLFCPVIIDEDLIVDGGMLDNCPEHIFDSEIIGDPKAKLNLCKPNMQTLALDIMTPDEMKNFQLTDRVDITDMKDFCKTLLNTLIIGNERRYITPSFWSRTIALRVPNIPLTHFSITSEQKKHLIECGYNSCKYFLEK